MTARYSIISLCIIFLTNAFATLNAFSATSDNPTAFNIESDPHFPRIDKTLLLYVKSKAASGHPNDFCVIGYRGNDSENAWVYWRQKNALILWEPQVAPVADLSLTTRYLDLKHDVVSSAEEIHGSTYLVTQSWVSNVLDACEKIGTKVSIH